MELLAFIFNNFTAIITIIIASVSIITLVDIMVVIPYVGIVEEYFNIN